MDVYFYLNAIGFGIGLAMDAFSVSMANGLNEPRMKTGKAAGIAGVFAFFQIIMPLLGWFCVHTIALAFEAFRPAIPWIALILLAVMLFLLFRPDPYKNQKVYSRRSVQE